MTKKLVVFDFDGTLLDSWSQYDRALLEYSAQRGLPAPCLDTVRKGYGHSNDHDFGWGVSREEQSRHLMESFIFAEAYEMSGNPEKTPSLFDGVTDALKHLKGSGHTMAIITTKNEAPLLHLLKYYDIGGFFKAHRALDDVKRRGEKEKPEPDQLQSVMRELGFAPEETVMIGDTTMDVRMGRNAETYTIGVTWGTHTKEHLAEAGAHHIVETGVPDILPAIGKIFA